MVLSVSLRPHPPGHLSVQASFHDLALGADDLGIPAVGYLLDTRPTLHVILIMSLLSFFFGILTLLSGIVPQFIGIGLLVVFRPLFYTAIS